MTANKSFEKIMRLGWNFNSISEAIEKLEELKLQEKIVRLSCDIPMKAFGQSSLEMEVAQSSVFPALGKSRGENEIIYKCCSTNAVAGDIWR